MALPNQGPESSTQVIAQRPSDDQANAPASGRPFLLELWVVTRRHWFLVLSVWVVTVACALGYVLVAIPSYTSVGVLQVSAEDGLNGGSSVSAFLGGGQSEVHTEVEIIKRNSLLLSVAHALNLETNIAGIDERWTLDLDVTVRHESPLQPELRAIRASLDYAFVPREQTKGVSVTLLMLDETNFELSLSRGELEVEQAKGKIGEAFTHPWLHLRFDKAPLASGQSVDLWIEHDGQLLQKIRPQLKVLALGNQRKPTNLVEIHFTDTDRHTVAEFVQTLMMDYLEQSLRWQALRASKSADFLSDQIQEVKDSLSEDEEALESFSEDEQAAGLDVQARVTVEESAKIRASMAQIDLKMDLIVSARRRLRQRIQSGEAASLTATFFEDPVLLKAVGALTEREVRLEITRATYRDGHPLVTTLVKEIAQQKREVAKLLETAERNLKSQKAELARAMGKIDDQLAAFPHKELEMARKMRDLEVSQRMYSFLLEKKQEAEILKASTTTDKRIVDPASMPYRRSAPSRTKILAGGAMLGLLLGIGAAFQVRFFRRRVESIERIREYLDAPVYGSIPALENVAVPQANQKSGRRVYLFPDDLWTEHQTPITEAFRALCVNVCMLPKIPGRARIVQVTSSESREGKSTVLSNLAVALRRSGAKVVLIDLDLRKPTQHRVWRVPRSPGYTDVVASGDMDSVIQDCTRVVGQDEVQLISAGSKVPETLTALMHQRLTELLGKLASTYDYVLVDSPPIFVPDALVLAEHADLLLITSRPGVVERNSLANSSALLRKCSTTKGLILNGVQRHHSDAQYYSSYGYKYTYSYAYTDYSSRSYVSDSEEDAA